MQGGELDITLNSNVIVRERGQRGVDVSTDTNDLVSSSEQPTKLADFDDGETKNKVNLDDSLDTLRSESDTEALVEQPRLTVTPNCINTNLNRETRLWIRIMNIQLIHPHPGLRQKKYKFHNQWPDFKFIIRIRTNFNHAY